MKLSDVLVFIKKYVTKQTVVMGLVVLSGVAMYTTLNTRAKLAAVRSELAAQEVLYSIVNTEKNRLEALIPLYKDSIQKRDVVIAAKDKKISKQLGKIALLEDSIKNNLNEVENATASKSYEAINIRIPAVAPLVFPFDSLQVKYIHYTLEERDGLSLLNNELNIVVTDLRQSSSIKDNQISDLNSLVNVYTLRGDLYKKEQEAYEVRIEGLNKDVTKQKRLKNVLVAPAAVGIIAVVIKLVAK